MIMQNGRPLRRGFLGEIGFYLWGGLTSASVIFVFCALWQWGSQVLGEFVLPEPLPVFRTVATILADYEAAEIPVTLWRALVSLSMSVVGGIILGLIAGSSKTMGIFFRPIISILLGMPPIIWVVLALFWFGMGSTGTIFTVIITVMPLTFAAAMRGMMTVDPGLEEMLKVFRIGFMRQIRHLYLPHLLNHILPALSVAIGTGIKVTIMAELLGSDDGMGSRIANARAMMDTMNVLAYVVIILGIIFIVEYLVVEPLRIWLMPWESR